LRQPLKLPFWPRSRRLLSGRLWTPSLPAPLARCRLAPACWANRRPRRVRETTLPSLRPQICPHLGPLWRRALPVI
jgi:hypothetical protein